MNDQHIIVVSGLPRSGTSLMMSMLGAGGVELLTDGERIADADNPTGYFEYERVKQLESGDEDWLEDALGKAVKVVSAQIEHLPSKYHYDVVFMHRRIAEIVASQDRMLARRGLPPGAADQAHIAELMQKHVRRVRAWLSAQPNIRTLDVDSNGLLDNPLQQINEMNGFLGKTLHHQRMVDAIQPDLYRNRA